MTAPNPPRPKVVAAGQASVLAGVLAYVLRVCGVDVDEIPPEVLLLAGGTLATGAAYLKRDGLRGAWQRISNGQNGVHPGCPPDAGYTTLEVVLVLLLIFVILGGAVGTHWLWVLAVVLLVLLIA